MELDNLKSNWKKTGTGKKSQDELLMMTKVKNHPNIRRMRIKFMIETILIIAFMAVYYDGFDGDTKPLWANLLLVVTTIGYIVVRFKAFIVLRNPIEAGNLKQSLSSFENRLNRIAIYILLTSFLFGSAIISFFSSTIDFTKGKYFLLAGMILSLVLLVYASSRNWFKRIEGIKTALIEFENVTD